MGEQWMRMSRSAKDLLWSPDDNSDRQSSSLRALTSTTSAMSLVQTDGRINCLGKRQAASHVSLPDYSQVFDMEEQGNMDSMAQDSGISSTTSSATSYSSQCKHLPLNTNLWLFELLKINVFLIM
jgi:hypothetical protein